MSRVKVKEQLVYFHKNIRKNNISPSPPQQQRPKTTPHRRFFTSTAYRPIPEQSSQDQNQSETLKSLNTLQINNNIYIRKSKQFQHRKTNSFIENCMIEKSKENKIKYNMNEGKIRINLNKEEGQKGFEEEQLQQFVDALVQSNAFFQKLERTMVESLTLVGVRKMYEKGEKLDISNKNIGFILFGKVKVYKQDYCYNASRGDTIGQNALFSVNLELKLKFLEDSAILWVPLTNYYVLRQQSVKEGFRHDFNKIETQLRLSFIKKKYPKD